MAAVARTAQEQTVLDFFRILSTGELEAIRKTLHPDAQWRPMVENIPGAGVHGPRDVIVDQFLAPVRGMFAPGDPKTTVHSIVSSGDFVMCESRGLGKLADGRTYDNRYAWAVELKDGLVYRIREYMPEDSARHVDWKATAKSGSLKVREFSREDERKLRLVFDNPGPGVLAPVAYERAIALAASLAWHFANEDADLSFAAQAYQGEGDIYKFLAYLALLEPHAGSSIIDTLPVTGDYNIVLTCRPRGSVPTALWNRSYMIFLGEDMSRQRGPNTRVPEKLLRTRS